MVYFLYKDVWPLFSRKLIPSRIREAENESDFRRTQEAIQTSSMNKIADATQLLAKSMSQTNERIAFIMDNQKLIIAQGQTTLEGMADLRAVTGTRITKKKVSKK